MSILRKMGVSGTALLWFESYLSDRSFRVSWRVRFQSHNFLLLEFLKAQCFGPLLFSIYMSSLGSVIQKAWLFLPLLCWWHSTLLLIPTGWSDGNWSHCSLSEWHSSWMMDHHLQLNLAKTKLLVFSANPSLHHNFSIQLGSSTITPSRTARETWSCDRWSVKLHRPYCYNGPVLQILPYTTLGRLGPSCQSKLHNSLSKLLFSPDWTIVMLSWRVFPHVLSSLCTDPEVQQPEWSVMSRKSVNVTPLSSSGYTGYQ